MNFHCNKGSKKNIFKNDKIKKQMYLKPVYKWIFEYIRIFSSEYWYSYSIRRNFQRPNIIRIFEYFARIFPNICLQKSLEIQRFWKFQFHFWHEKIILQQIINCKNSKFFNPLVSSIQVSLAIFWESSFLCYILFFLFYLSKLFKNIRIFCTIRILFEYFLQNE